MNRNLVTINMMQSEIRSSVAASEARAADLAESNREQAETIETLRAEDAQLSASFVTLKARCDELTEMAIGRDAEIERLHNAIEALRAELDLANAHAARLMQERDEARLQLVEVTAIKNDAITANEKLASKILGLSRRIEVHE